MYRFVRTATVRTAAEQAKALQWAGEVCGYLNRKFQVGLRFGVEVFGELKLYWFADSASSEKLVAQHAEMLKDQGYLGLLEQAKPLFIEGSLKDVVVLLPE